MAPIEILREYIKRRHPGVQTTLSTPVRRGGTWFLDIDHGDKHIAVEWSERNSFAIASVSEENFGERPDESHATVEDVQERINRLLMSCEKTQPPVGVLLARLRERLGFTQKQVARMLDIRQASVSGIERRAVVELPTLQSFVEALGASASLHIHHLAAGFDVTLQLSGEGKEDQFVRECPSMFECLDQVGLLPQAIDLAFLAQQGALALGGA